jgi:hypothetical protein
MGMRSLSCVGTTHKKKALNKIQKNLPSKGIHRASKPQFTKKEIP